MHTLEDTRLLRLLLSFGMVVLCVSASDPQCKTGIAHGDVCCAEKCGRCSGQGCGSLPGGAASCCADGIEHTGHSCNSYDPPCVLGPPTPPPPPSGNITASLVIDSTTVEAEVDERFVSFTIDTSQLSGFNFTNPVVKLLASSLSPAVLRVGGTQADYEVYGVGEFVNFDCDHPPPPMTNYRCKVLSPQVWQDLQAFSADCNSSLVFGLNDMFGRPTKTKPEKGMCGSSGRDGSCPPNNQSNIAAFLQWNAAHGSSVFGWELGNELNSVLNGQAGARQQAQDFIDLKKKVLEPLYGESMPLLIGPDTHSNAEFDTEGLTWFQEFVSAAGSAVDIFTFHMYALGDGPDLDPEKLDASYLNPQVLDRSGDGVKSIKNILSKANASNVKLWGGETAAANNGGQSGITDTYIDGFWYLDQLGSFAVNGVNVFCRQTLESNGGYPLLENYQPLPDYWIALIWKQLMGTKVLSVKSSSSSFRAYTLCSKKRGEVVIAWLNIGNGYATVEVDHSTDSALIWTLTSGQPISGAKNPLQSKEVLLNGKLVAVQPDVILPDLSGEPWSGAAVPPTSYGFLVLPSANAQACL
eukprot:m.113685 g.113685  ORF g.113685 m.113685 type:complete len:581 (-) comp14143_c0_seq2:151-1893(-)